MSPAVINRRIINTPPISVVLVNSASVRIGVVFPLDLSPAPSIAASRAWDAIQYGTLILICMLEGS
jgi:hypothetical protein